EKELGVEEAARNRWLAHWSLEALKAVEGHLAKEKGTGRYCHGDMVTLADVCVASQVIGARDYFKCDVSRVPTVMRVYGECMKLPAFENALPHKQPDAQAAH
ncbi:MAG TPA: maleylacetoacetate isomerase, partial [Burkholderiales bacterium]|nr:maleylacetoacetate isomerase [Burkholderiales bacterium]